MQRLREALGVRSLRPVLLTLILAFMPTSASASCGCGLVCTSTNMTFGCLSLYTSSLSPASPGNVPMTDTFVVDYYAQGPSGGGSYAGAVSLKLGPPGSSSPMHLQTWNWCCVELATIACGGTCVGCDCTTLWSGIGFGPSAGAFAMPSITPGWYELSLSMFGSTISPILVNLTYPDAVDLTVDEFDIPDSATAGQTVFVSYDLRNHGELSTAGAQVDVYMSDDPTVTTSDQLVGSKVWGAIPGGYDNALGQYVSIPSSAQGTKYFNVRVTAAGAEVDYSNNWAAVDAVDFKPDMRFAGQNLTWLAPLPAGPGEDPLLSAGDPFTFDFEYENEGNSASAATTAVEVRVADNSGLTGSTLITTLPISPAVVPGDSGVLYSGPHTATLPSGLGYVVGSTARVFLEFVNAGDESSTSNNKSIPQSVAYSARTDLALFRPSGMISPGQEVAGVGMAWVNLDNDDADTKFDGNPSESGGSDSDVTGGDDELARMEIRLKPNDLAAHVGQSVRLNMIAHPDNVKFWNAETKGTEYTPGVSISIDASNDFEVDGEWLVKELWIEGAEMHGVSELTDGVSELTEFELEYESSAVLGGIQNERFFVLGVEEVKIAGLDNGYDVPDHEADELDEDPNMVGTGVPSARIFAGARGPDYDSPRNEVNVQVFLNAPPLWNVDVYLRPFDIDDPATDTLHVDPNDAGVSGPYGQTLNFLEYSAEEDNRGPSLVGQFSKAGELTQLDGTPAAGDGILQLHYQTPVSARVCRFRTSIMPGDNYRIVASNDRDHLVQLRNRDQDDGFMVVDPNIGGSPMKHEIRLPEQYASPVLAVWRLLHIEMDSMQALDLDSNILFGKFSALGSGGTSLGGLGAVTNVTPLPLDPLKPLDDGSPNLDSTPSSVGRFEDGFAEVSAIAGEIEVEENGDNLVLMKSPGSAVPLDFSLDYTSGGSAESASGQITDIVIVSPGVYGYELNITASTEDPVNWNALVGGSVAVETTVTPSTVIYSYEPLSGIVVDEPFVPFELRDDDDRELLPIDLGSPLSLPIDELVAGLVPASILPQVDGGTHPANNTANVFFSPNASGTTLSKWFMKQGSPQAAETSQYWIAYLGASYQGRDEETGEDDGDWDPDGEGAVLGESAAYVFDPVALPVLGPGGDSSWVHVEAMDDYSVRNPPGVLEPGYLNRTVAHEVAHQLGLPHHNESGMDYSLSLMAPIPGSATLNVGFTDFHVHLLRCRIYPVADPN